MGEIEEIRAELKEVKSHSFAWEMLKEQGKQMKRLWIALLLAVLLLFISNMAWLWVFQSYDYASYQQDGSGVNNIATSIGGDVNNGAETKN